MKKILVAIALAVSVTLPAAAQTTEFGALFGAAGRSDVRGVAENDVNDNFSFDNRSFDIYWATEPDTDSRFKIKLGRFDSAVGVANEDGSRHDVEGQVQHVSGLAEYRFSEFYGTTGLFAGVGYYRAEGGGQSDSDYGFSAGVNGDFPINRRYGVIVEGTYHWTNLQFRPRFTTVGAGLRVRF